MHCKFVQNRVSRRTWTSCDEPCQIRSRRAQRPSSVTPSRPVEDRPRNSMQRPALRGSRSAPRLDRCHRRPTPLTRAQRRRSRARTAAVVLGLRPGLGGRGGAGHGPGLPEQLAHHRARDARGGRPPDRRRLGHGRPRPVPAELPLPRRGAAGGGHRARQDLGHVLRRARPALRAASPASPRARSRRSPTPSRTSPSAPRSSAACAGSRCPPLWFLLGARRRRELVALAARSAAARRRRGRSASGWSRSAATQPWSQDTAGVAEVTWQPISAALPDVPIPEEAQPLEVDAGLLTQGTKRLVESALDSYRTSSEFYREATDGGGRPRPARCTPPPRARRSRWSSRTGTTTSSWTRWPARSPTWPAPPSSSTPATTPRPDRRGRRSASSRWTRPSTDIDDRFFVAGNHDHGDFITEQAAELGFTTLDGRGRRGTRRHPAPRRRRPPVQRAGQLA